MHRLKLARENRDSWHKAPESQPPQTWRTGIHPPFFPEPAKFGRSLLPSVALPNSCWTSCHKLWAILQVVIFVYICYVSDHLWRKPHRTNGCPLHCVNWYLASHRMQLDVEDVLLTGREGNMSAPGKLIDWFNVDSYWVRQQLYACNSQNQISTLEPKGMGFWGSFNNSVRKEKSNAKTVFEPLSQPVQWVSQPPTWPLLRPLQCVWMHPEHARDAAIPLQFATKPCTTQKTEACDVCVYMIYVMTVYVWVWVMHMRYVSMWHNWDVHRDYIDRQIDR